jgi:uncharacterized Ntn-hydrolase superfamily protein
MASRPSSHVIRAALALALILAASSRALAAWSIVAVDQSTGTVVIAAAACVAQSSFALFPAKGLMDLQAVVVPGKGVAVAQAATDMTRANQDRLFVEIDKGTDPQQIIELLKSDKAIDNRQFGIVDLQGRAAGFTGSRTSPSTLDRHGQVSGAGIVFSIQGDLLASDDVVTAAEAALRSSTGAIADRVMAAMEAADAKGGDKRCSCDTLPRPKTCETKTSQVAYILRAEARDARGPGVNDGKYAMYVSVSNDDITPSENANPVRTLRLRFDAWKKAHPR